MTPNRKSNALLVISLVIVLGSETVPNLSASSHAERESQPSIPLLIEGKSFRVRQVDDRGASQHSCERIQQC